MSEVDGAFAALIESRVSIRAYLPTPVAVDTIKQLLELASTAPSGVNTQPWRVHVATGQALERLTHKLVHTYFSGKPEQCEYQYYPVEWNPPYVDRRRVMLKTLFTASGVERGDEEALKNAVARNYAFYGAPAGLVFTIDRSLAQGSWLDYGMFLQTLLLAARAAGLDTCAEVSIANYPDEVRQFFGIPDGEIVVCGVALGYRDRGAAVNRLNIGREPVSVFTSFHD